jgi:hypothetical protein
MTPPPGLRPARTIDAIVASFSTRRSYPSARSLGVANNDDSVGNDRRLDDVGVERRGAGGAELAGRAGGGGRARFLLLPLRHYDTTTLRHYDTTTLRHYDATTLRHYDTTTRHYGTTLKKKKSLQLGAVACDRMRSLAIASDRLQSLAIEPDAINEIAHLVEIANLQSSDFFFLEHKLGIRSGIEIAPEVFFHNN